MIVLQDAAGKDVLLNDDGTCELLMGTELTAYIDLDDGYSFSGWTEDTAGQTGTRINFTVTDDTTVSAKINKICICRNYVDLNEGDWYHDSCVYTIENGLMTGIGENTFGPSHTLSRAMMLQILYNLEGRPQVTGTNRFVDVKNDWWYTDAIIWGTENGITHGIANDKFAPDNMITREQMVTMLFRYAAHKGIDTNVSVNLSVFADAGSISGYAKDAMAWAVAEGIVVGTGALTLEPQDTATRAEAATIMKRYVEYVLN